MKEYHITLTEDEAGALIFALHLLEKLNIQWPLMEKTIKHLRSITQKFLDRNTPDES